MMLDSSHPVKSAEVRADVLVIGAGPAGLAAATQLRRLGVGRVVVVDREQQAGGRSASLRTPAVWHA